MTWKKPLIALFHLFFIQEGHTQLDRYKYVVVPLQFEGFKKVNQFRTSTLIKMLFTREGFNTVYDPRFDEYYLAEFIWLSDSPTVSFRLLKTSEEWAKKNNYKYIVMSLVDKMPKKDSLSKAYQRMGFIKESEQYIKKLGD